MNSSEKIAIIAFILLAGLVLGCFIVDVLGIADIIKVIE